jgi:Protein of unknown function (DUF1549)/Protein of unknown function (DUF1553)/Planctomycete cytochrome C
MLGLNASRVNKTSNSMQHPEHSMFNARHTLFVLALVFHISGYLVGQPPTEQATNLFENSIRPVLVARCVKCHGPTKAESGLRLDNLQSIRVGGDSGPAVIPGDVAGSLLASVIDHQHEIKMPPDKPLSAHEIQAFRDWIAQGAHWPEHLKLASGPELRSGPATDAERAFWAFQPLVDRLPTQTEFVDSKKNAMDHFIQTKLREKSLLANPRADKLVLIRRITFDLTGLPPTPEAIERFVNDSSPHALDRLVDRLLDSPAYGERWGRHWLDVVRYSDTAGETADYPVPDAWRYRHYVIDAFNKDKPYDQFLREQIAGDILAYQNPRPETFSEQVTATGFIAIARRFGFDSENYHHLTIQDTIDTIGQATLGLSLGCARCHDHKFDPVSTEDYYALYGIFSSTLYPLSGSEQKQKVRSLAPLQLDQSQPAAGAQLAQTIAFKQETLKKLGRAVPPVVLRSLTEMDSDFELQSPAAGGSRGVLVAPWLYDGPIAVTNAAQSPFVHAFPKGKVGVSFPAGRAMAGIWQALNHRSLDLSLRPLTLSVDFRVGAPTATASGSTDLAADLAAPAKSLNSTEHHGLRLDFCESETQPVIGLLIGASRVELQIGEHITELVNVQSGRWYNLELSITPENKAVSGVLKEHDAGESRFDLPVSSLPSVLLTLLKIQTSQVPTRDLPLFELDNVSVIPGTATRPTISESLEQIAKLGDSTALQTELKTLIGIDGDLELQIDKQQPALPWNPGPNSVVKIASSSQSPFRNYYDEGSLGIYLPNRSEYDGFGLQLERVQPNEAGHIMASFDFRCVNQDLGGSGSWRYYLGHGPGNSAAIELFFNGNHFFCRSANAKDPIAELKIGTWYQVQIDLDTKAKTYSGKLVTLDSQIEFSGQAASNWDGTIDYTFIDSYGHIGGVRPALDADNFSLGQNPNGQVTRVSDTATESNVVETSRHGTLARRERIQEIRNKLAAIQSAADELEKQLREPPVAMSYAVAEGTPRDVPIQMRGEPSQSGKLVARRMPQLLASNAATKANSKSELAGSGRLELANWITKDARSLAARVMVNRVWQHHFGRGLVRTENDFGTRGEMPTHPELLDWLACRFIESGWSIKQLHRMIILSDTYQQSSQPNEQYEQVDPENRWLWRFSPRRLSAEEIRDAHLGLYSARSVLRGVRNESTKRLSHATAYQTASFPGFVRWS